jgi:hypothetical protein
MRAPWDVLGGIVVDDGVDRLSLRHLRLDGIEEADELLMAVALHVVSDDGAVEDVEGGEHGAGAARLHRQFWPGAVERLDLALFSSTERTTAWAGGST